MSSRRFLVLAVTAMTTLAVVAEARMVIAPSAARACRDGADWKAITGCLARYGTPTLVAQPAGVRVMQLADSRNKFSAPGLYLYTQHRGRWILGGALEGDNYTFVKLEHGTYGGTSQYRMDVTTARVGPMILDDQTRRAHVRQSFSAFCPGASNRCVQVMTSCDVYVDGKIYWTFRGKLELAKGIVRSVGDRSNADGDCRSDAELLLPVDPDLPDVRDLD